MTQQLLSTWRDELPPGDFGTTSALIASFRQNRGAAAVMLTCWELCDTPDDVSHAAPGQILIVQNPGGLVPCDGAAHSGSSFASISLGLAEPTVKHLIVCSHRDCCTIPNLLNDCKRDFLPEYREIVAGVREELHELDGHLSAQQRRDIAVQETVLQQLVHLRSYPRIRTRLASRKLRLHGWVYDDHTARIHIFNPYTGRFGV